MHLHLILDFVTIPRKGLRLAAALLFQLAYGSDLFQCLVPSTISISFDIFWRTHSQNILFSCISDIEKLLKFFVFTSPLPIPELCGTLYILSVGNLIRFCSVRDHLYIEPSLMCSFPHILQLYPGSPTRCFYWCPAFKDQATGIYL